MNPNWNYGSVTPWWGTKHRELPYLHEPFNNDQDLEHWQKLGFTQTRFTGDMYDMRQSEPNWIEPFRRLLPLTHFSWSVYCMRPGDVLPQHGDTFQRFRQLYGISDVGQIKRYIVFLETWQSGHYFEIDGMPISLWSAGEWISWNGSTLHMAANLGSTNRYTLQITGFSENT